VAANTVSIKIEVDKAEGQTQLAAFQEAFTRLLTSIGKTPEEVQGFYQLFAKVKAGEVDINSLDAATKRLIQTYRQGAKSAENDDLVGLNRIEKLNALLDQAARGYQRVHQQASEATTEASSGQEQVNSKLKEAIASIQGWGHELNNAKGSLASFWAGWHYIKEAIAEARHFESAFADVAKLTVGTEEEITHLGHSIAALSKTIPLSTEELAKLAASGAKFGFPVAELTEFTRLAAQMSIVFGASSDQIAQQLRGLRSQYGLTIEELKGYGATVYAVSQATGSSAEAILDVINKISGATKQFGLSKEEASAFAGSLLSTGIQARVAKTAMETLLLRLQNLSALGPEVKQAFSDIGIEANKLAADIRSNPSAALQQFLETLNNLDKKTRGDFIRRAFGIQYIDDLTRISSALGGYEKGLRAVGDAQRSAAQFSAGYERAVGTLDAQFKLLNQNLKLTGETIGGWIIPYMTPVVEGFKEAAGAFQSFVAQNPELVTMVGVIGGVVTSAKVLQVAFKGIGLVGTLMFPQTAAAIGTMTTAIQGAIAQSTILSTVLKSIGPALIAGFAGYQIGTWLYREFEVARQAGIYMIETLVRGAASVQHAWEMVAAVFNSDTIEEAHKRYYARVAELDKLFDKMHKDAKEYHQSETHSLNEHEKEAAAASKAEQERKEKELAAEKKLQEERQKTLTQIRELREDMQKLGLDSEVFTTGVTAAEREVVDAFTRMSENGRSSAQAIMAGFQAGIQKVSTSALPEMELALHAAFNSLRINSAQLDEGMAALGRRMKAIVLDTTDVREAAKTLGVDASIALGGMSANAEKVVGAFAKLVDKSLVTKNNFEALFAAALKSADSKAAVESLWASVDKLQKSGANLGPAYEKAMTQMKAKLDEVTPGINSADEAMKRMGLESQSALNQMVADLQQAYDALVKFNAPVNDQKAAWLKLAEAQVKANRGVVAGSLAAKAAILGLSNEFADLIGKTDRAKVATEKLAVQYKAEADSAARNTQAVRERGTALVAAAQQALELAKAQGDSLAIEKATLGVREAEAKAANELAAALASEAASARTNVVEMQAKANADGIVTDAERQLIAQLEAGAAALTKEANAAKLASSNADAALKAATEKSQEIRTATIDWSNLATQHGVAAGKASELAEAQAKVWAGMQKMYSTGFGSMDGYIDAMNAATARAAGFVKAMGRVEEAAAGGDETLGEYIRALRSAINQGSIMGREEMAPLRSALRDAQQRMRNLGDSARDTLNSLRDELDEMNKNYDEIERRRAEARRTEIEAQLAIAKSAGNSAAVADLQRALNLLREVSNRRLEEAKLREQEDARAAREGASGTAGLLTAAQTQDRTVVKVVDINIKVGGETGTAQVVEGGEEVIVDMLRKAQMVAS
jgi:TP901 family phage tail tape measure protein